MRPTAGAELGRGPLRVARTSYPYALLAADEDVNRHRVPVVAAMPVLARRAPTSTAEPAIFSPVGRNRSRLTLGNFHLTVPAVINPREVEIMNRSLKRLVTLASALTLSLVTVPAAQSAPGTYWTPER